MRLVKHEPSEGEPTTYTIKDISILDLASIQLALLMIRQTELRVGEDWVYTPLEDQPAGKHEVRSDGSV